ncbi:UNVERIFIED_CONTAM: hypothetical protein GTU68_066876, partial [Idotea baltica]|nr:hypothetical protein [Idotea baltica]
MLEIKNITKQFGEEQVLKALSLKLGEGEILSILGKSGSGKSTLLKIIAGLEAAADGALLLDGKDISNQATQDRKIVYMYQEPLLFPHLDVRENLAFGLSVRGESSELISEKTAVMLKALQLEEQAEKMPHQLSGGQKQRVNFGRAMIIEPRLVLLDEPFGNLDSQTREAMQELFIKVAREQGITALFVTHDVKEALQVGTRYGFLERGQL